MAIRTTIARHYSIRLILMTLLCFVFGVWGIYDYVWRYPEKDRKYQLYLKNMADYEALQTQAETMPLSDDDAARYSELKEEVNRAEEAGENEALNKYDRPLQWAFIVCLPFAFWSFWQLHKTRSNVYELDDEGVLHLPGGETWARDTIADIDMERWMAKSMAWVVHEDGRRELLDDYKHRNLHLIIGALASEKYPDEWDADAKPIKHDEDSDEEESSDDDVVASSEDDADGEEITVSSPSPAGLLSDSNDEEKPA